MDADRPGARLVADDARPVRSRARPATEHLVVGDVDAVVEKILFQHSVFGHTRFMAQMSIGPMPHDAVLRSIELFGTEVAPRVRAELG